MRKLVADLNQLHRTEAALHELDFDPAGFQWIDCHDAQQSVVSFVRRGRSRDDFVLVILNATPVVRTHYRVGVPRGGWWREILNTDAKEYGGGGLGNLGGHQASSIACHGRPASLDITLPALSVLYFKSEAPRW